MPLTEQERNAFIMDCIGEGLSLSEVQDRLAQQYGIHLTYMELRMLTAELQVNWSKQDAKADAARAKAMPKADAAATPAGTPSTASNDDGYGAADGLPPEEDDEMPAADDGADAPPAPAPADDTPRGSTTVEVSKVVRPGASLSGSVTFGSGASGEWYVDAYGRLGLSLAEGSSKPDQQDVQEFQLELQKKLGY